MFVVLALCYDLTVGAEILHYVFFANITRITVIIFLHVMAAFFT
jgi:hypothetical protein